MSGYIGPAPVPQATQTRQAFTATSGQTTFNTAGYTPGYLDVYLNGVKLAAADYTATNGSDVVLASGAAANDILEVVAFEIFQVADQDFTGDFSVDGDTFYVNSTNDRVGINVANPTGTLEVDGPVFFNGAPQSWSGDPLVINSSSSRSNINFLHSGTGQAAATDGLEIALVFNNAEFSLKENGYMSFETNNTEHMRITPAGKVGIGTTTPGDELTVVGQALFSYTDIAANSSAQYAQVEIQKDDVDANWSYLAFHEVGSIAWQQGILDNKFVIASTGGASKTSTDAERLVIDTSGNVGIGTTGPNESLHIYRSSGDASFKLQNASQTLRIDQNSIRTTTGSNLGIFTNGNNNQIYLVQSTGNVGIGTSSPNAKLDINGKLEADELSIQQSSSTGTFADFYNAQSGVDNRVAIRTVANGSGDPYLFFDAGGTNMVVGNFWQGTNTNELRMGPASKPSDGTFDGIRIRGNGATLIGDGFTQVSSHFTDAQLTLGGVHNSKFNTSGKIKLLISGVDNDSPAAPVKYIRCEDENGAINFDFNGPTTSDGRNAYLGMNANLYVFWDATTVGSITRTSTGTTYATTSDRRLKTDIQPIANGTEKLMAMNPVTHKWIANPDADAVHGFVAQEMQEVVPEAVSGEADGEEMMSMDYGRITPVLVAALQDAHKKIELLEQRLTNLEAK